MQLKNTKAFLEKICQMDIPISSTARGEQIHQTFRNNLTVQLKDALFEDMKDSFPNDNYSGILPYITKEGIVLELPNVSIADNTPDDYTGAISIEFKMTFKGLEFSAPDTQDEYFFQQKQNEERKKEAEAKKASSYKKQLEAKRAREAKRSQLLELLHKKNGTNETN